MYHKCRYDGEGKILVVVGYEGVYPTPNHI